nr:MAG TPA: hypothetical protein [Bacteriophage sp.]
MGNEPPFRPDRRISSTGLGSGGYETTDRRPRPENKRANKTS